MIKIKKEVVVILFLLLISNVIALDCPRGIENDSYPGVCGLYADTNQDGLCDLSQKTISTSLNPESNNLNETPLSNKYTREYYFLTISIITLIFYLISLFASRKNIISRVTHRKIWNILLLLSFLAVGISGILLVLKISYNLQINYPIDLLFSHVETGIVMALISIFHILWHIPYFKSIIRKS